MEYQDELNLANSRTSLAACSSREIDLLRQNNPSKLAELEDAVNSAAPAPKRGMTVSRNGATIENRAATAFVNGRRVDAATVKNPNDNPF